MSELLGFGFFFRGQPIAFKSWLAGLPNRKSPLSGATYTDGGAAWASFFASAFSSEVIAFKSSLPGLPNWGVAWSESIYSYQWCMIKLLCIDIMVRIDLVCSRSRDSHLLTTICALPTDLGGVAKSFMMLRFLNGCSPSNVYNGKRAWMQQETTSYRIGWSREFRTINHDRFCTTLHQTNDWIHMAVTLYSPELVLVTQATGCCKHPSFCCIQW